MPRDGVRRTSLARHGPMDIGRLHGSVIGGRERPLYLSCPLGLAKRCVRAFEANSGATVAGWRQTIRLRASPPCRRLSRLVDLADAAQSGSEIRTALEPRGTKSRTPATFRSSGSDRTTISPHPGAVNRMHDSSPPAPSLRLSDPVTLPQNATATCFRQELPLRLTGQSRGAGARRRDVRPPRLPEREADQRAAAPVCLAYRRRVNALPEAAPSDSTSRSLQTPAPRSFSLARSVKPCDQSLRARDSGAEPERRFLPCAHKAHLWPWSTSEHSSPIEDACTSSWESHPWVLRRGFSSSRTSRAGASVVSNGPTRDSTPARDELLIAKT